MVKDLVDPFAGKGREGRAQYRIGHYRAERRIAPLLLQSGQFCTAVKRQPHGAYFPLVACAVGQLNHNRLSEREGVAHQLVLRGFARRQCVRIRGRGPLLHLADQFLLRRMLLLRRLAAAHSRRGHEGNTKFAHSVSLRNGHYCRASGHGKTSR